MIFEYLVSITIILVVFLTSIKSLNHLQKKQLKQEEKIHRSIYNQTRLQYSILQRSPVNKDSSLLMSQKGFISLMGLSFIFIFSLIFFFYTKVLISNYQFLKNMSKTHLCIHEISQIQIKYSQKVARFNQAIFALNLGKASLFLSAESQAAITTLKLLRQIEHLSFVKKIAFSQYCQLSQKTQIMRNLPYKTNLAGQLELNPFDLTIIRSEQWDIYYFIESKKLLRKTSLSIRLHHQFTNILLPMKVNILPLI